MQRKGEEHQPVHARQRRHRLRLRGHASAEGPAAGEQRQRGTAAPPRPPRPARRHARPPADQAACCLFPCRETDSAASRCRARRDLPQPPPSTHGSCPRRRHGRTRSTRAPAAAGSARRRPPRSRQPQFGAIALYSVHMIRPATSGITVTVYWKQPGESEPARNNPGRGRRSYGRDLTCRTHVMPRKGSRVSTPSGRQTVFSSAKSTLEHFGCRDLAQISRQDFGYRAASISKPRYR